MSEKANRQSESIPADSCVMAIFGATGDLTKRKLYPALYNLKREQYLPENFAIFGFGKEEMTADDFRKKLCSNMREFVLGEIDEDSIDWFIERTYYHGGDFSDKDFYENIGKQLETIDENHNTEGNWFFYMATPPSLFATISQQIDEAGLANEENGSWCSISFIKSKLAKGFCNKSELKSKIQSMFFAF